MDDKKNYALGYYNNGHFNVMYYHNSLTAMFQVKRRVKARLPQVKFEIKKVRG